MHLDIDFVRRNSLFFTTTLKDQVFLRMQEDHIPASRL